MDYGIGLFIIQAIGLIAISVLFALAITLGGITLLTTLVTAAILHIADSIKRKKGLFYYEFSFLMYIILWKHSKSYRFIRNGFTLGRLHIILDRNWKNYGFGKKLVDFRKSIVRFFHFLGDTIARWVEHFRKKPAKQIRKLVVNYPEIEVLPYNSRRICVKCGHVHDLADPRKTYIVERNVLVRQCTRCTAVWYERCKDGTEPIK